MTVKVPILEMDIMENGELKKIKGLWDGEYYSDTEFADKLDDLNEKLRFIRARRNNLRQAYREFLKAFYEPAYDRFYNPASKFANQLFNFQYINIGLGIKLKRRDFGSGWELFITRLIFPVYSNLLDFIRSRLE